MYKVKFLLEGPEILDIINLEMHIRGNSVGGYSKHQDAWKAAHLQRWLHGGKVIAKDLLMFLSFSFQLWVASGCGYLGVGMELSCHKLDLNFEYEHSAAPHSIAQMPVPVPISRTR
jgi:hypothetical protein